MIGKKAQFCQKTHDKWDVPARNKIKEILGDFVKDHPDQYAQDLIINSKTCKYKYLELQVCTSWIGDKYPFKNVWVYARKARYNNDTLFLTLDKNMTQGYLFDADSIKGVKPRRLRKWSREFVYDIPWCRALNVHLDCLDKETIELY